jgi:hypothetical protein
MAIPASKVRAICTESEAALVRASRKPELELLSHAEVTRLVAQARKLFRKWRDLGRSQARARSEKVGFGEKAANTRLKVEIFEDTVKKLEARLAKLDASDAAGKKARLTKQDRSAEHRATRAAIRKGMTAAEDLVNEDKHKKRAAGVKSATKATAPSKAVTAKSVPAPAPAPVAKPKPATKSRRPIKPATTPLPNAVDLLEARSLTNVATLIPPKKLHSKIAELNPAKQRKAITAAKQSRVLRSGKTTRTLSHVKARGKRHQARRDAKG